MTPITGHRLIRSGIQVSQPCPVKLPREHRRFVGSYQWVSPPDVRFTRNSIKEEFRRYATQGQWRRDTLGIWESLRELICFVCICLYFAYRCLHVVYILSIFVHRLPLFVYMLPILVYMCFRFVYIYILSIFVYILFIFCPFCL